MSKKERPPSDADAVQKPGWPEGFWEEFNRMPFPDDFELGEELPDQADRAVGWSDERVDEGQSCQ
jgi:hypothetical protein